MADGASSVEDSPDNNSDFSRTCTTTGHRKRRDDDSDLVRTHTATGLKKRSLLSQTAAHTEERLAVERLQHIPFYIASSLPSGVSVASEARPIIVFYSRFRDTCIYIYLYLCVIVIVRLVFEAISHTKRTITIIYSVTMAP